MSFGKNRKRSGVILAGVTTASVAASAALQGIVSATSQSKVASNVLKGISETSVKNSNSTVVNFLKNNWGWILSAAVVISLVAAFKYFYEKENIETDVENVIKSCNPSENHNDIKELTKITQYEKNNGIQNSPKVLKGKNKLKKVSQEEIEKIEKEKKKLEEKRKIEQQRVNNIKSGFDNLFETNKSKGDEISEYGDSGRVLSDLQKLGNEHIMGVFYMSEDEAKKFFAEGVDFSLNNFFSEEELNAMRKNENFIEIKSKSIERKVPVREDGKIRLNKNGVPVDEKKNPIYNEKGEPLREGYVKEKEYWGVSWYKDAFYNIFNEEGKIRFVLLGVEEDEPFDIEPIDGNEEEIEPGKLEYTKEEIKNFEKVEETKKAEALNANNQFGAPFHKTSPHFHKAEKFKKIYHFRVAILGKVKDKIGLSNGVGRYEVFPLEFITKDLKNNKNAIFSFLDKSFKEKEKISEDEPEHLKLEGSKIVVQLNRPNCKREMYVNNFVQFEKQERLKERETEEGCSYNPWGLIGMEKEIDAFSHLKNKNFLPQKVREKVLEEKNKVRDGKGVKTEEGWLCTLRKKGGKRILCNVKSDYNV